MMGAIRSKSAYSTSQENTSTFTADWWTPYDEMVTLVKEVQILADKDEDLPLLVQVAATGSTGAVQCCLQESGGLWARDTAGRTPLHWAAGVGSESVVRALLALEADVGARDGRGGTPLHHAAMWRNAAVASRLLKAGASSAAKDSQGRTPLMWAAYAGDAPLCQLLTGDGMESVLEAADISSQTALHVAAEAGRAASVRVLVARGASVNAVDGEGRVPLHCALYFYHKFLKGELQASHCPQNSDGKVEAYGEDGNPAEATRQVVVWLLTPLEDYKSTLSRDNLSKTPLMWALELRLPTVARLLIDACPPDRWPDVSGKTALHYAARAGDAHIVDRLLHCKFSPWIQDSQGCNSLMAAVESRDVETVRILARNKKYFSCKNAMGKTALHIAVDLRDVVMVQCLVDLSVAVGAVDGDGRTALFCALEMGEAGREIAQILMPERVGRYPLRDGRGRTLLHAAVTGGDVQMVRHVLQRYTHSLSVDSDRESPLSCALRLRHRAVAAELLQWPFPVEQDQHGRTPLHWAAAAGWREEARILHQAGCGINQRDRDGRTASGTAIFNGHLELAREMIQWTVPKETPRSFN